MLITDVKFDFGLTASLVKQLKWILNYISIVKFLAKVIVLRNVLLTINYYILFIHKGENLGRFIEPNIFFDSSIFVHSV